MAVSALLLENLTFQFVERFYSGETGDSLAWKLSDD